MSDVQLPDALLGVFWAKLPREIDAPPSFHPLICHLLDVAAVAEQMWDSSLSPATRLRLARGLGLAGNLPATRAWVAALAGLHDTGKACAVFQKQPAARSIQSLYGGLLFSLGGPEGPSSQAPHGAVTAGTLGEILVREGYLDDGMTAGRLARIVGGHHGFFPGVDALREARRQRNGLFLAPVGGERWDAARTGSVRMVCEALGLRQHATPAALDDGTSMILAEITCVADWIGSNTTYFSYLVQTPGETPPDLSAAGAAAYLDQARTRAVRALEGLHWTGWEPQKNLSRFRDLFPLIDEPCDLQIRVEQVAGELAGSLPALLVVEAPTGEGKTEAALYAADRWGVQPGPRGMYVAMPTQATSNQMFSRVKQFLTGRYPGEVVNLQLLHGHSALSAELQAMLRGDEAGDPDRNTPSQICDDDPQPRRDAAEVIAGEWFTAKKRGLLAPMGVGTVDQALLAVLKVKHQFVRLGALAGKTVIFDEVHAYDAYMSVILECLLSWLAHLGSPVLLLSATLPRERRESLLRAYARGLELALPEALPQEPYPRLSWVSSGGAGAASLQSSSRSSRAFALRRLDGGVPPAGMAFPLGELLRVKLAGGGCAAVICNTVRRAREVYARLKEYFPDEGSDGSPELALFHARFRFLDRDRLEKQALIRFGRQGGAVELGGGEARPVLRPRRSVLVATSVIEQSLDLDFDLMVSDPAPVDLLLQRAGRLQRHQRDRPPGLGSPELYVCEPESVTNGVPQFEQGTARIYDGHILLRSWLALRDRQQVAVPGEVEELIEAVYGRRSCPADEPAALQAAWEQSRAASELETAQEEMIAEHARANAPFEGVDVLEPPKFPQEEDAEDVNRVLQARTRLGDMPVQVIVLSPAELEAYLALPRGTKPTPQQIRYLVERSAGLTEWQVRRSASQMAAAPGASASATLRGYKVAYLDQGGVAALPDPGFRIRLDDELGVVVEAGV